MSAQLSGLLHGLGSVAAWLVAQLKITASNIKDIVAALVHINLTWLIHPIVVIVAIWVIFKIVKKVK